MRKLYKYLVLVLVGGILIACSEDLMDRIDTNPNSPTDVPISLLLPSLCVNSSFSIQGVDLAWYSSVMVEHTAGVHGQLQNADDRTGLNASTFNNSWNNVFAYQLKDLKILIEKGSVGGSEEGRWVEVGIAKVLTAWSIALASDLWGDIPYSEIGLGKDNRKPKFDSQESIYQTVQNLLDEAITDFGKTPIANPGASDVFFGGDVGKWIKTCYSLKARYYNRLSEVSPALADNTLDAIVQGFESEADSWVFDKFNTDATGEHPWFQESNDRSHHAISQTFFDILNGLNDPRILLWFGTIDGQYSPAPNGNSVNDQAGTIYSRATSNIVSAIASMPMMTYTELKFIEAEAQLRAGENALALAAYTDAVSIALQKAGVTQEDMETYMGQTDVIPADGADLTLDMIITQKYISFWLFESIEAYNDWRRTGIPSLKNAKGIFPLRFNYAQSEIDSNGDNVPSVNIYNTPVWWDK